MDFEQLLAKAMQKPKSFDISDRFKPLRDLVAVEYADEEHYAFQGSLIYLPDVAAKPCYKAVVLAVGPGRWSRKLWDYIPLTYHPGDIVETLPLPEENRIIIDGREVFIVNQDAILGRFSTEHSQ